MGSFERKQREFAKREKMVIESADSLLLSKGYLGLNLDVLAEKVEYSKATLYQHFTSKEDLVLAVVNMHVEFQIQYFTKARNFEGLTRERIIALGVADRLLRIKFPHFFPLTQLIRSTSIWSKCSEKRQKTFFLSQDICIRLTLDVINDARSNGDLSDDSPELDQIMWGLICLSKGAQLIAEEVKSFSGKIPDPLRYLSSNHAAFLDGVGWRPLYRDFDYDSTIERINQEFDELNLVVAD